MIRSMTAFARVSIPSKGKHWAIEIRSLNHRYFEFSLKLPPALNALENQIRELVQSDMHRGKITVSISQDAPDAKHKGVSIDDEVVEFYLSNVRHLKKRYKLEGDISISDLIKLPGVFSGEESDIDAEKNWPELKKVLTQALAQARKAKEIEGKKLAKDIDARLDKVTQVVKNIENNATSQSERIFKRISERISALLTEKDKDQERINREVAFLAERSDITEELVRMKSHLDLFKKKIKQESEVGRELDFLCQEMNREVNTMASKAQHFEISTDVVFIKGELEKIREQIQNIE
jgi:uncharacterized protein (TIGR00255 family)